MAKYRIGQLSKLLGIPATTIRYYEQCGILSTKHDPNGYRYYDEVDIHNLMHYEYYRSLDYHPNDATHNLYDFTIDQMIANGTTILEKLEYDLWFDHRRVQIQQDRLSFLNRVTTDVGQIEIKPRPILYVLPYRIRNNDMTISLLEEKQREQTIAKWMEYMPLVSLTPVIESNDFFSHRNREGSALVVRGDDARKIGLHDLPFVYQLDGCNCLRYTLYRKKGYMHAFVNYAKPVYEYMDDHGLTIDGHVTFAHYVAFHKHTDHEFYGEMMVPFKKI